MNGIIVPSNGGSGANPFDTKTNIYSQTTYKNDFTLSGTDYVKTYNLTDTQRSNFRAAPFILVRVYENFASGSGYKTIGLGNIIISITDFLNGTNPRFLRFATFDCYSRRVGYEINLEDSTAKLQILIDSNKYSAMADNNYYISTSIDRLN